MSIVLITGASGYIGSTLCGSLIKEGKEVHVLIRESSDRTMLLACAPEARVHVIPDDAFQFGSMVGYHKMKEIMESTHPSAVVHLASNFIVDHKPEDIPGLIESNIAFGALLLEAMHACSVRRIINVTTYWEHYNNEQYNPVNLYAATKRAFVDLMKYYIEALGFNAVNMKLSNVYGPGDPRPKIVNLLQRIAASGETLPMSPGYQQLEFAYIDDVVNAFSRALDLLLEGIPENSHSIFKEFLIRGPAPITLRELVALFEKITGRTLKIEWGARPYREREIMELQSRGDSLPGWQPRIDMETGIRNTLAALQS